MSKKNIFGGVGVSAFSGGCYSFLSDLPKEDTVRWVTRHRRVVATLVGGNVLPREKAKGMYSLSDQEIDSWMSEFNIPNSDSNMIGSSHDGLASGI